MNVQSSPVVDTWNDPDARVYLTFGIIAAFAMCLALMQYSDDVWIVAPTLVTIAGLLLRWISAPVFMLLAVALNLLATPQRFIVQSAVNDGLLAGSVVAAMLAHFRLYSITNAIFPQDFRRTLGPRRQSPPSSPTLREFLMAILIVPYLFQLLRRRDSEVITPSERRRSPLTKDEWPRAVAVIALSAGAAIGFWTIAKSLPVPLLTIPAQWHVGLFVWLVIAPIILASLIINYRGAMRRSMLEAHVILNDELWRETRREQRKIARKIERARLQKVHERSETLP